MGGGSTFTYDARNRLISAVEPTGGILPATITRAFTYTARGALSQVTDGVTPEDYNFDALGRLTGYSKGIDSVSYTYDGLDRIAQRSGAAFTYSGFEIDPTSDGNFTFSRSPAGRILSLKKGTDVTLAGLNRHGDLSYLFDTSAQVSDTKIYDPFGKVASETGNTGVPVGFQGDFTDPASSKVWMGARWYGPSESQFLSRDTVFGQLRTPISLNHYTYAFADPMNYFDADGHWPKWLDRGISRIKGSSAYRATSRAISSTVSTVKTASKQAANTIRIQAGRAQHRVVAAKQKIERTAYEARRSIGRLQTKIADTEIGGARLRDWAHAPEDAGRAWNRHFQDKGARAMDAYHDAGGGTRGALDFFNLAANPLYSTVERGGEAYYEGGGGWRGARDAFNVTANPAYHAMVSGEAAYETCRRGVSLECVQHGAEFVAAADSTLLVGVSGAAKVGGTASAQEAVDVGISTRGIRPASGTRVRPEGIPESWRIRGTREPGGTHYYDPKVPYKGDAVRVMQGDPFSPFPVSRSPYVRWQRHGHALDVRGNKLPDPFRKDAHIPLNDFRFLTEAFE